MAEERCGLTFSQALGIMFIGLKMTGHISWPWIWVLSPVWIGVALLLLKEWLDAIKD